MADNWALLFPSEGIIRVAVQGKLNRYIIHFPISFVLKIKLYSGIVLRSLLKYNLLVRTRRRLGLYGGHAQVQFVFVFFGIQKHQCPAPKAQPQSCLIIFVRLFRNAADTFRARKIRRLFGFVYVGHFVA